MSMVGSPGNTIPFLGTLLYWPVLALVALLALAGNVGDMPSCIGLIPLALFVVPALPWRLSCCCTCLICSALCATACPVLSKLTIDKPITYLSTFI